MQLKIDSLVTVEKEKIIIESGSTFATFKKSHEKKE
jgi:hypothetical protein